MAEFKNQFSWSKSRHDLFESCRRKYYFNYYGSWNGWRRDADERTRRIYYLKKLQTRHMWIGSVVHVHIERLLKAYRSGSPVPSFDEAQSALLADLRNDFRQSRAKNWYFKKWLLFEHEYEVEVADDEWKAIADQALLGFSHFWNSEIHKTCQQLEVDQWLEIEDFSHFYAHDVKVHVVLDFSYRDGDQVYIYDWKTGQGEGEIHALQLACYRIYAAEAWKVPENQVTTCEFNVTRNQVKEYTEMNLSTGEALEMMGSSMHQMKSLLVDIEENRAREEDFEFASSDTTCKTCNFREVCPRQSESVAKN